MKPKQLLEKLKTEIAELEQEFENVRFPVTAKILQTEINIRVQAIVDIQRKYADELQ